ncbi:MAG: type IV toxin-antitoxin system AbiEi family antitoxin domain-containing protein [Deltaproteobacteria bacterium]|nr:type IV toxin-antitoxin system AbiEi family antitoxin domain-containing protein [Deltaproteobacteria bacterium]
MSFARKPSWDRLYEVGNGQEGHFTTQQAAEAGYAPQLLRKHIQAGRILRVRRGIYRLVHFPAGEHEELVVVWLWSERQGVFSHQTALGLHGLSDVLPSKIHLSVPASWSSRRLRVPAGVIVHHADVAKSERSWFGAVPATSPSRTLEDCSRDKISLDLLRQAARDALARGLVDKRELAEVRRALRGHGGIAA